MQDFNTLNIGKSKITCVNYVRYLGILLDDQLNWKFHISHLCNSLTKVISAFKLIKTLVPLQFKRQLYYAYCFSRISYGIEVYGASSKIYIRKIQVIQNGILKTLYNKDRYTLTNILHKNSIFYKYKIYFHYFN